MIYSLEADPNGVLLNGIINATNGATAGCSSTPPTTSSPSKSPSASPSQSKSSSPTASPSKSTSGSAGTCTAPAWNASTAYVGGQVVSYVGHQWTAKWWTQGEAPNNNTSGVWTDNGPCGGGGGGTGNCAGLFPWSSSTPYNGGQSVMYTGHKWTAKWWTQGDTPGNNSQGVWTDNGAC